MGKTRPWQRKYHSVYIIQPACGVPDTRGLPDLLEKTCFPEGH